MTENYKVCHCLYIFYFFRQLLYEYSRGGNPTRTVFETCIASLEAAKYGEFFHNIVAGYILGWRERWWK